MEALLEKTTREDQRIAKTSVDKLRRASQKLSQKEKSVEIMLPHSHESLRLPSKAISLLSTIISNMAAGKSMAIILSDTTVGTQEAADYLDVSRPYVVRLLEKGEIPYSKVGTHRRIKVSDLVAYQKKMKAARKKQLNFLARQAQELHLGYSNE
ncbi:MAG: helix-turn-helix domain-containing protein [Chitinophagaceae bacterium]|nr:helix-turn-helix domain-containing protein [Chitinophagaceae bacterium]